MKRIYIAIILIVIGIGIGILQTFTINSSTENCLNSIKKIETNIENNNIGNAIKICNSSAQEYESLCNNVMYCYYVHSELSEVSDNLYIMNEYLKHNQISDYYALSAKTKKQLHSLKEKELIRIQNIL